MDSQPGFVTDVDTLQNQPVANTDVFLMLPVLLDVGQQVGLFGPALGAILEQEVALAVIVTTV